ncbi:hypothetical protein [Lichenibacterium ramalinae]|nr:hypothetical protein [Lichenibacterium ramalinae]
MRWSSIVGAGLLFASLATGPARAIDIPIQIPGCPDRSGADVPDRDGRRPARRAELEQSCGGGGGGGEAASAYPGVSFVAPAGGGGGGGGGGGTSRTAASDSATTAGDTTGTAGTTGPGGLVLGPATNQSPNTGAGGGGGSGRGGVTPATTVTSGPTGSPATTTQPAATPTLVVSTPTNQSANDFGGFGFPSVGSDHGAPLPDLGGPFAWLLAIATGALLLRRRVRG